MGNLSNPPSIVDQIISAANSIASISPTYGEEFFNTKEAMGYSSLAGSAYVFLEDCATVTMGKVATAVKLKEATLIKAGSSVTPQAIRSRILHRLNSAIDISGTLVMCVDSRDFFSLVSSRRRTVDLMRIDEGNLTMRQALSIASMCDPATAAKYLDSEDRIIRRIMRARVLGWI